MGAHEHCDSDGLGLVVQLRWSKHHSFTCSQPEQINAWWTEDQGIGASVTTKFQNWYALPKVHSTLPSLCVSQKTQEINPDKEAFYQHQGSNSQPARWKRCSLTSQPMRYALLRVYYGSLPIRQVSIIGVHGCLFSSDWIMLSNVKSNSGYKKNAADIRNFYLLLIYCYYSIF